MSQSKVVSIGGIEYDSHTGLPVVKHMTSVHKQPIKVSSSQKARDIQPVHANGVHTTQQRSATLNRRFVAAKKSSHPSATPVVRKNLDFKPRISRSAHISKFAPEPQAVAVKRKAVSDVAHHPHPVVAKVHATQASKHHNATPVTQPTAKQIKHAELGKALANAKSHSEVPKRTRGRALHVATATLGLLLLAGYFTYVNMPNLSVRVAAAQAGINATFPEYRPVGYSLNGPVAYQDGEVSMKFSSNSGPLAFSLNQTTSAWDSAALLEKYVNPKSESNYATYSDGGLTIYTYGTNAAWVNGGILYTIEGTANLSNEQIRRIATSM